MKPLKILISSFSISPVRGGEAGVGWHLASGLAQIHRVWVLADSLFRAEVDSYLREHPQPNLTVVYVEIPLLVRLGNAPGAGPHRALLRNIYYSLWQLYLPVVIFNLHRQVGFSVTHHLTWQRYWWPSMLALLPVPFFWGPVGGAETIPLRFWSILGMAGKVEEFMRLVWRSLGELNPLLWLTARRSRVAFATTPEAARRIRQLGARDVRPLSAVAISDEFLNRFDEGQTAAQPRPFRLISLGRLVDWKGHTLALHTLARLADLDWEYSILGDGPERRRLQALANRLGIGPRVVFCGTVEREVLYNRLAESQVLLHFALHESGGMAVTEAMAAGKPVVCLALGGPALQVTPGTGFAIEAANPQQVVEDASQAIRSLVQDKALVVGLGRAARQRARQALHWQGHLQAIQQAYQEAIPYPI